MSCFATIKSPLSGRQVTSPAYYQLTSFYPPAQGKEIYEALTTNTFKTELGFDWTKPQLGMSPKLNFRGEPSIHEINKNLKLKLSDKEIRAAEQIEEVASLGYLNIGFKNTRPLDFINEEININPKYNLIESEIVQDNNQYYLSVKPSLGTKRLKPISKEYLSRVKFPATVINSVTDFSKASLDEMITGILNSGEAQEFQVGIFKKLQGLLRINPTLRVVIFDDAMVEEQYQRSFYNPATNIVYIGKTISSDFNTPAFIRELLHETIHAYTIHALTNPQTREEILFAQDMEKFVAIYRDRFPALQSIYGLQNAEEFVSEYLSNPEFREQLYEAETRTKKKNFISEFVGKVKRFLFGQINDVTLEQVDKTIKDYFDYLQNLEDMPELAGEYELRFNAPPSTTAGLKLDANLEAFRKNVDATFNSSSWSRLATALSEIDPRYGSLQSLQNKYKKMSTANAADMIKHTTNYIAALQLILTRTQKNVELHQNNSINFDSDELIKIYNNANIVAKFILEQLETFKGDFLDQLKQSFTKEEIEANPYIQAEANQALNARIENFKQVLDTLNKQYEEAQSAATRLSKNSFDLLIDPAAVQLSAAFTLMTEKLQNPNGELQTELREKKADLARLEAVYASQNLTAEEVMKKKQYQDLKSDIESLDAFNKFIPTKENIVKLIQGGTKYGKETSWWGIYMGVANQSGSPLVQVIKQFLDVHLTEAGNAGLIFYNRSKAIESAIVQRNQKRGVSEFATMAKKYEGLSREADMTYYDSNGVKTVVRQKVYNTKFLEAEFHSDLRDLERNLELATIKGVEAEILAAESAINKFQEAYAVRPYTDEYYEAEELLIPEARQQREDILEQIKDHIDIFGDIESSPEDRKYRAKLRVEYERLGSIYELDGTEKLPGTPERAIADSIIAYKAKRKDLEAVEFIIPDTVLQRFNLEKTSRQDKVSIAKTKVQQIRINQGEAEALGLDISQFPAELLAAQKELEVLQEEQSQWLKINARTEIDPRFFVIQKVVADQIKAIFVKYGESPEISEAYDKLFSAVKGFRDKDGVIDGSIMKESLSVTIKEIEESLEAAKQDAEDSRQISDEDKVKLKGLFQKLFGLQTRTNTEYYEEVLQGIVVSMRGQVLSDATLVASFKTEAQAEATSFLETGAFLDTSLNNESNELAEAKTLAELQSVMYRTDLIASIEQILIKREINKRVKETTWYKNNHIKITKQYVDKFTGELETTTYERPIYIWSKTTPKDPLYIMQENPSFEWSIPRIRDAYKNKDHNFLGKMRPRQTADNKYTNTNYPKNAEDQELVDSIVTLYEDIQRTLPVSQRLNGYVFPNQVKLSKEEAYDFAQVFRGRFKGIRNNIVNAFRLTWKWTENAQDNEIDSSIIEQNKNAKFSDKKGVGLQLIKTRFKQPLRSTEVSEMITSTLGSYGAYAAEFQGLKKAMPAIFAAYEQSKGNVTESESKIIAGEITRFFYGAEVATYDSPVTNTIVRLVRGFFRFTQKRVLLFNIPRLFKNMFANFYKIMLSRNRTGFTRMELMKAFLKGLKMHNNFMQIENGSVKMTNYALKLTYFRALPSADPSRLAGDIHQGNIYKYVNLDNYSAQVFGYTEAASTIPIYEAAMARVKIPVTINGQTTQIQLDDAYDVIDGMLVPKEGVFGLEQDAVRKAITERKDLILSFLSNANVRKYEDLGAKQKIQLGNLLKAKDAEIAAIEKRNKPKRESLRSVEQALRDEIHSYFTSTQGNYYKRSRSQYESNLFLQVLMSMRKWLYPLINTNYGSQRINLYTGSIQEGAYRGFGRSMSRKLKYLASKEREVIGTSAQDQEMTSRVARDTRNILIANVLLSAMTTYLLQGLQNAGSDDDDEPSFLLMVLLVGLGTLDEIMTFTPVGIVNFGYKTFFRQPLKEENESFGEALIRHTVALTVGQTVSSGDAALGAILDPVTYTDPFGEYAVRRRAGAGTPSDFKTPEFLKGRTNLEVALLKYYGIDQGVKFFTQPDRKLYTQLKYNPNIFIADPVGDYDKLQQTITELKTELTTLSSVEDINEALQTGNFRKIKLAVSSERAAEIIALIGSKDGSLTKELANLKKDPYINAYEQEKKIAAYEGQQAAKLTKKLLGKPNEQITDAEYEKAKKDLKKIYKTPTYFSDDENPD